VKKILVLGSQGYIGTRLSSYLLEYGYSVIGIDLGTFAECLISDNFTQNSTITKDVALMSKREFEGFDVVINLASRSNDPTAGIDSGIYYEPAVKFSGNIARICSDLGIKYIFPSSCSVYGASDGICDETTRTNPITDYSKSKLKIEQELSNLANVDFTPIALRFATVFGYSPRMRFDIVVNMFTGMLLTENKIIMNSNGMSWRPHIYIDDVLEAFRCVIEIENNSGVLEIFNVGNNSNNLTILDTAKMISSLFPSSSIEFLDNNSNNSIFSDKKIVNERDIRDYQVNFDRIYREIPAYTCKTSLIDGVLNMISLLKQNQLNTERFRNTKFYRMQYLDELETR
jgi:nucleoside-diphosphate-sugar epimerase